MTIYSRSTIIFSIFLVWFGVQTVSAQLWFEVEAGLPFVGYNEVRVPNSGTPFDFEDDFALDGLVVPVRLRASYTFKEKNEIIGLAAPLSVTYTGVSPRDINFQNTTFEEGVMVDGLYKFNSFRLTYRRQLVKKENWWFSLGFTAKIRDARIRLRTGEASDFKNDVGFVPLLHIYTGYQSGKWSFLLEGDGLAGGPGRAFDVFAGAGYHIKDDWQIRLGYRIVEGGADIEEVFNFALIQFAALSVHYSLPLRKTSTAGGQN